MRLQTNVRTYTRGIAFVVVSTVLLVSFCISMMLFILDSKDVRAAAAGDYRSKVISGNWNVAGSWEIFDGISWIDAVTTPTSADGEITILDGHTISLTANVTVDQLVLQSTGVININTGKTITIADGAGTDFLCYGTLTIFGTVNVSSNGSMILENTLTLKNGGANTFNSGATLTINNGGRYKREDASMTVGTGNMIVNSGGVFQHNIDGQNIPRGTWNNGAICEVTGITGTKPGNLDQAFHHFIFNSPNMNSTENFSGKLTDVNGDLTFISTGATGIIRLGEPENYTLNIDGNLYMTGGKVFLTTKASTAAINIAGNLEVSGGTLAATDATKDNGEGVLTINLTGNLVVSSGTFDFTQYTASTATKGNVTLNLQGNYIQTGGTVTETAANTGYGRINFAKTGTQFFSKTSGTLSNTININVNSGATVDMGNNVFTGSGAFTVVAGGGLSIGSPDGITATGGTLGNVQTTGTRTFSTSGNYTYNATASQVTGNGLPGTVNDLIINNSNHVSLSGSVSIAGTLNFTSGNIITNSDTVTVGISTAALGAVSQTSGQVVGNLKRWIAASVTPNILFPIGVGGYDESITYSFTTAPTTGGTIAVSYSAIDPGRNGFDIIDAGDTLKYIAYGLWSATPGNGLAGGTFTVDILATALPSVTDPSTLHLLNRSNAGSNWVAAGTHAAGTGSVGAPVVHRTGLTVHGQFGIGSGQTNTLPIQLVYFTAKQVGEVVKFNWATASEINNESFTVERSADGENFESVLTREGAGNSTNIRYYNGEDKYPIEGNNYYHLKQKGFDGRYSYSDVKIVRFYKSFANGEQLKILSASPNPFTDHIRIEFYTYEKTQVDISLVSSAGLVISTEKFNTEIGNNTYELSDKFNLARGVYFIYIKSREYKITHRIVNG